MELLDMPLVHTYSRAEALADGSLIDVTEMAKEAGFRVHTVITRALHETISNIPEYALGESYEGRLWDVLWMCTRTPMKNPSAAVKVFPVIMSVRGGKRTLKLHAVAGPDDEGAVCMTIGYPEDF